MSQVVETNIRTGQVTERDFTPEEKAFYAENDKRVAEQKKEEEAKAKKAEADLKVIKAKAKEDPAFAALARHMGVDV